MGPRASARGNFIFWQRFFLHISASMGPRASARGNRFRRTVIDVFSYASMGPRASARGNWRGCWRTRSPATRFNGAARVRTRKSETSYEVGQMVKPLQWGRARPHAEMRPQHPRAHRLHALASMGPRASARGNRKTRRPSAASSPCFNGAARVRTRKSSSLILDIASSGLLQWGRARPHAEISPKVCTPSRALSASMGPRASARGNSRITARPPREPLLQWGRARPHAEIGKPWDTTPATPPLQWGRARPHAEIGSVNRLGRHDTLLQWGRARPHAEMG